MVLLSVEVIDCIADIPAFVEEVAHEGNIPEEVVAEALLQIVAPRA